MKKRFNLLVTLGLIIFAWTAQAQYDDVYYGGSPIRTKSRAVNHSSYSNNSQSQDDQFLDEQNYNESDNGDYDDEEYNYLDDYDYSYTHRIRRFHRPLIGRSFYDPFYVDPWNYDPYYYSSGFGLITPSLGLGFYSFSDYNRWNRWYHFNQFRYWDPWTYSYWSYDPFSYSRFSNYYWASNTWCPSSWYSNRLYSGNSYWGNSYNGAYQPRYYTNTNVHFGPRTYGATTTGDRGPSRTSSRIFSDPNDKTSNPGLRRYSPRDGGETTIVRERNTPVTRDRGTVNPEGAAERISPRATDRSGVRERTSPSSGTERIFRDYNNGTDQNQSVRPSPRSNDRLISPETNPRTYSQPQFEQRRLESPRQESPNSDRFRSESPRQESPRFESPRQESPRFESPRQESPRVRNDNEASTYRQRSNNFASPESKYRSVERSTPRHEDSGRSFSSPPSHSNSGSSGSFSGGSSRSGNSPSSGGGGGGRTSPRNN